ncbi:MAG: ribosome maturation factor RimM [Actinomycetota bacterium]|nr:ribosome maturation factor RimM [Actinomycetota bacterium]
MDDPQALVGVVGKPVGLRGEVHVRPDPDLADDFAPGRVYRTVGPAARTLVVAASRAHGGRRIVRFQGVDDRSQAESLRGLRLTLPRAQVALADDAFWTSDLLGRDVVDEEGALLGVVEATLDGAAHDYLVVARPDGGEVLVPAVAELVEVTTDRVVVQAIPGLMEPE